MVLDMGPHSSYGSVRVQQLKMVTKTESAVAAEWGIRKKKTSANDEQMTGEGRQWFPPWMMEYAKQVLSLWPSLTPLSIVLDGMILGVTVWEKYEWARDSNLRKKWAGYGDFLGAERGSLLSLPFLSSDRWRALMWEKWWWDGMKLKNAGSQQKKEGKKADVMSRACPEPKVSN